MRARGILAAAVVVALAARRARRLLEEAAPDREPAARDLRLHPGAGGHREPPRAPATGTAPTPTAGRRLRVPLGLPAAGSAGRPAWDTIFSPPRPPPHRLAVHDVHGGLGAGDPALRDLRHRQRGRGRSHAGGAERSCSATSPRRCGFTDPLGSTDSTYASVTVSWADHRPGRRRAGPPLPDLAGRQRGRLRLDERADVHRAERPLPPGRHVPVRPAHALRAGRGRRGPQRAADEHDLVRAGPGGGAREQPGPAARRGRGAEHRARTTTCSTRSTRASPTCSRRAPTACCGRSSTPTSSAARATWPRPSGSSRRCSGTAAARPRSRRCSGPTRTASAPTWTREGSSTWTVSTWSQGLHTPGALPGGLRDRGTWAAPGSSTASPRIGGGPADSTAGWSCRAGSSFRSSVYGESFRALVGPLQDGRIRPAACAASRSPTPATWRSGPWIGQLEPPNTDFEVPVGVTVPQGMNGRIVLVTLPDPLRPADAGHATCCGACSTTSGSASPCPEGLGRPARHGAGLAFFR